MSRSTSLVDELAKLDSLTQGKSQWQTKTLMVQVAESLTSNTEKEINVVDTLGHDVRISYTSFNSDDVYWLPASFNENSSSFRANKLAPFFVKACREAGFKAHLKGWEKSRSKDSPEDGLVRVTCARNR